jgi:hypothetical protein
MLGTNGPNGDFYEVFVTIDGGTEVVASDKTFKYYK